MSKIITYFSIVGYEEDTTPIYEVEKWECEDEEDIKWALNFIDENLIISIK
ncbi:MAG: hypothetical protein IJ086_03670 [Clostridium sp.]|nr:hypothetical protein [Clostridium sp.]